MTTLFLKKGKYALLLLLVFLVSACASSGQSVPEPRDLSDRLAYAQSDLTSATNTITSLVLDDKISIEVAEKLEEKIEEFESYLKMARLAIYKGDNVTGEEKLKLINDFLIELNKTIKEKQ